jgi:probable HAF family extracellular repeat protein
MDDAALLRWGQAAARLLFTTIDIPGATGGTTGYGINDSGQIVGGYSDSTGNHGFVYTAGSITTIAVPGPFSTSANGINDSGQIVGYFKNCCEIHGFLATPTPEPGTLPLLIGCLIGLAVVLHRNLTIK